MEQIRALYLLGVPLRRFGQNTKWLPSVFVVYFFFNGVLLPQGLLYTSVLAPLFYYWTLKQRSHWVISKFMLVAIPIAALQLLVNTEINYFYFLRSLILYLLVFISAYAFYLVCRRVEPAFLEKQFIRLIKLNFIFALFALSLRWTPFADMLWTSLSYEQGQRLQLLTYEPSYYSTLMVPLIVFALYRLIFRIGQKYVFNFFLVVFPCMLSLSLGVISGLVLAFGLSMIFMGRRLLNKPVMILLMLAATVAAAIILGSENPLSSRLALLVSGNDSSGSVRVLQSNYVAWKIAESTSYIVGSGFGQAKNLAIDFFDEFWFGLDVNRLTNVVAATFAEFGLVGILLRFSLELYLFFRTKVYQSPFRITLFMFVAIYQFTGSYTTNLAEYVIWVLAFTPVFFEFEKIGGRRQASASFFRNTRYRPVAQTGEMLR